MNAGSVAYAAPLICATLAAAAPAAAPSPTVEDFFRRPQYADMSLSPDGKRLVALTPLKGRANVVVVDLETRKPHVITSFDSHDAASPFWINNRRLCFQVVQGRAEGGERRYRGRHCVDADGSERQAFPSVPMLAPVEDESGDYIIAARWRSQYSVDLYRRSTRSTEHELLTWDSPGDVVRWVLDRALVPRIAVSVPEREAAGKPRIATVWHRATAESPWEKLWSYPVGVEETYRWPLAFDFDNETLYVAGNEGRDRAAIYAYDTKAKRLGNLVVEHPLIDVSAGLVFSKKRRKLVGVHLEADKPIMVWTDPELDRVQRAIDASLPRTVNVVRFDAETESRALVYAYSDTDPGAYYLYDAARKAIEPIAKTREWLAPERMAERRFMTYKARDGMTIPAWVTIPRGAKGPRPLVVHVHGGPWVRAYRWAMWDYPVAQYLASLGYVVLEPEPRGSTGFGRRHLTSSFGQWGRAMQDDLADGARHLVRAGLADESRMCLHGASYGGYAALQGLVREPDLWRCGSAFAAPSDLGLMQRIAYSDTAMYSDFLQEEFKVMVGDSDLDAVRFEEVSPARNAARIKAPVLLAMGSLDPRVPDKHGDVMRSAMEAAGKKIEYVLYVGEGHGFRRDENLLDYYRRLARFLAEAFGEP